MNIRLLLPIAFGVLVTFGAFADQSNAQTNKKPLSPAEMLKKVTDAMQLIYPEPRNEVDCEYPRDKSGKVDPAILKKLTIRSSLKRFGHNGWIVADATGRIVRVFLDKNKAGEKGAGTLDEWIYFKDGVEVYREIDTDFNERPNEYRWSGAGGSRWGFDDDQDGKIDRWRVISAEEVALEVFQAIKNRDAARYNRLLLTEKELQGLNLGSSVAKDAATRLKEAREGFANLVRNQKTINASSKWIHSGNGMPSMAVADGKELRNDLICYDHATSVYQTGNNVATLALGSVVRVGNVWRLMELPQFVEGSKPIINGGVFFPIPQMEMIAGGDVIPAQSMEMVKLYEELNLADEKVKGASEGVEMAAAQRALATTMIKIYSKSKNVKERSNWLENIADTVADAYRQKKFPDGLNFLRSFGSQVARNKGDGVDYIEWRAIFAEYGLALVEEDARGREKARQEYLTRIEKFASQFPKSKFAPKALWELGQSAEVEGDEGVAVTWYNKLATSYGQAADGKRGLGALRRIKGLGKKIPFSGATVDGRKFDITNPALRGKIVVVHFWETWCANEPINQKGDTAFDEFAKLSAKYKGEVEFVGANIEEKTEAFKSYMAKNKNIKWSQLHAPGGMEKSPLATQVGLVSEPLILIFDGEGKLAETDSAAGDLDQQIQRIRNKARAAANNPNQPKAQRQ